MHMKLLVNTTHQLDADQMQYLQECCPGIEIEEGFDAADKLNGKDVNILVTEQVPRNLAQWPQLQWVQLLSAGANQILGHPIVNTAIPVTTASGTHGVPIAQYITCAWLMMLHRMNDILAFKPTHAWPDRGALAGTTARELTAGIIGYGSIGRESARQLYSLGMRIFCLKQNPANHKDDGYNAWPGTGDPAGLIPEKWFSPAQLDEMLPQCDLVVVTVPSTPNTEGMIGKRQFELMKKTAGMIIISRGGIVQEDALADALRSREIAEATVDCFVKEPLPSDHFFFDVPNLTMTPHMSGVYKGFWPIMVKLIGENLRRFKNNEPLLNPTSKTRGY